MPSYIDEEGYEAVLKTLEKILDFFEDELGRDDRQGRWLGGAQLSLADVTLGVWQYIQTYNTFFLCKVYPPFRIILTQIIPTGT